MTFYQWLCLLGVPSILTAITGLVLQKVKGIKSDNDSVKLGIQALLRAQMIADWNKYSEKGYAPIYAKDSFESCWVQYHNLGANGVMNGIHEKFMALPDQPKGE
jgi:hypothetical protein